MIQASNITLRLGKRALFEDVNIKFTEGNCYGLSCFFVACLYVRRRSLFQRQRSGEAAVG